MQQTPPASPLLLRPATRNDVAEIHSVHVRAIRQLGRNAYSEAECESWASGLKPERYEESMTEGGQTFLVAEDDDGICGFCSFKDSEVIGLYVDPRLARCGLGAQLLKNAEAAIAAAGHEGVKLEAALSAKAFYLSQGYQHIRDRRTNTRGGIEVGVCDFEKQIS
ncbi:MAG: GNAT family N-acetyltransferase [Stappiaceae bacterium]